MLTLVMRIIQLMLVNNHIKMERNKFKYYPDELGRVIWEGCHIWGGGTMSYEKLK